jgi:hypothetical protein
MSEELDVSLCMPTPADEERVKIEDGDVHLVVTPNNTVAVWKSDIKSLRTFCSNHDSMLRIENEGGDTFELDSSEMAALFQAEDRVAELEKQLEDRDAELNEKLQWYGKQLEEKDREITRLCSAGREELLEATSRSKGLEIELNNALERVNWLERNRKLVIQGFDKEREELVERWQGFLAAETKRRREAEDKLEALKISAEPKKSVR